jgi:O-antigen biosynthesis protein WbqP
VPQLWCILKGEMSFVGLRPELFNQYDLINFRTEKNVDKVLPGLTGWSQVNGRDELPILEKGTLGETYNIGGWNEITNLIVVQTLYSGPHK